MDIAYETFISGDRIIDASFVYMLILMGVTLLVVMVFKFAAWISDRHKSCESCGDQIRKKDICQLCECCDDCCYCQYDAEPR
jgi:hypothetical protein